MREVVMIHEGDSKYEGMVKRAKDAIASSDNTFIVANGEGGRKVDIEPLSVMHGISFYVVHEMDEGLVYSSKNDDETIRAAVKNTISNTRIGELSSVLDSLLDGDFRGVPLSRIDEWVPENEKLYVLTNDNGMNGAGILFCKEVLKKIWEKVGNYYLIPSSVHELLIVPDQFGFSKDVIDEFVAETNRDVVMQDEVLINRAFYFDGRLN